MSFPLPTRAGVGHSAVYETDVGRVWIEFAGKGWFGLENVSQGYSGVPRNRAEILAWLARHGARFDGWE